ncbi:SLAP domain-containing protein [Oceanobacillus jeddahense]|uniref:SLAP domain-containing protein n=1 Tax=Oceanobacillus jeddahense TaxID=1462527 RepID=A0ABY5JX68_9BACI|nr:SLAP domain-containing protein [Oceanobacillus jeddahense]UUI04666.1 SLAP domain-containing protein [Oceanobacillus jeddahense]
MNLVFEPKWDKALPDTDRQKIEKKFQNIVPSDLDDKSITFTPLWQARNHRSDVLVTVLINNFSGQAYSFDNSILEYVEDDTVKAIQKFTLERVLVPPDSSMPWTFIFPKSSLTSNSINLDGSLKLHKRL